MSILEQLKENIKERALLYTKAKDDTKIQQVIIEVCKRDIIYWFNNFMCTDRNASMIPSEYGNNIPFIPFEYQKEYILDAWDAILTGQKPIKERTTPTDLFSEKSRQMGFSWVYAGLQVYAYMFHNMKSLYISKKADEVDKNGDMKSHFEKIRFIIKNLPSWMLPPGLEKEVGTECNKYMNISRKDGTGSIIGDSANPGAGRGGTFAFALFDEMAFMPYASSINMSISSATPCRFYNSTPNGEGNEYYRMRKLALEGKIRFHRCHWSENPFYTQEWYNWKTKGMTKEQIAQELEIDYNIALEGRVYREFTKGNITNLEYNENKPLYVCIDNSHGGSDPNAIIVAQKTGTYIDIIDCMEINTSPQYMAEIMAKQPKVVLSDIQLEFYERYKNYKQATFISDPYDTNSKVGNNTISEEYQKVGIFLNIPQNRDKRDQILKTRTNMPRIRVDEKCRDFISAIQNAIYPQVKEGSMGTSARDIPVHDWTSHYRTALEYLVCFITENESTFEEKPKGYREVKDYLTGEIRIVYD